jgi:transcriptional regulator with XRE-family HTH domain
MVGATLRELRRAQNLSQFELGDRCGYPQAYMSRVENGLANPTISALNSLVNGLGLTIFEFFDHVHAFSEAERRPKRRSTPRTKT